MINTMVWLMNTILLCDLQIRSNYACSISLIGAAAQVDVNCFVDQRQVSVDMHTWFAGSTQDLVDQHTLLVDEYIFL